MSVDKNGRGNFAALLDRLRELKAGKEDQPLLPLVMQRLALADGCIEFADMRLDEPLVTRIETLGLEVGNLSTLPTRTARYRLSARTADGGSLQASGDLALNPVATSGRLALKAIKLASLARGLSDLAALDSSSGRIDFRGRPRACVIARAPCRPARGMSISKLARCRSGRPVARLRWRRSRRWR
ncbi:MAG: DUF748 domain-containing protein [Sulfuritalea sp.]|nr:DUF748 domain-containing protein [Sulfuritalea sp.]